MILLTPLRACALNEGRGANPGDTWTSPRRRGITSTLNKGPGRETRRHSFCRSASVTLDPLNEGRGREPRRHDSGLAVFSRASNAQQRPGREPRRHVRPLRAHDRPLRRSTKAGARTPATPETLAGAPQSTSGRSTKAGARTPATRSSATASSSGGRLAQQRPGREPRRHQKQAETLADEIIAQRRPGREPRRHRQRGWLRSLRRRRSTKAGARTPGDTPLVKR